MTGNVYGADVVELRSLSERMLRSAADLDRIVNLLTHQITATTAWVGPNAQRFRGEWSGSHRGAVASSARALRDCAAALRRNADDQDRASAADFSSVGPTWLGRSGVGGAPSDLLHADGGGGHGSLRGLPDLLHIGSKGGPWASLLAPGAAAMFAVGLMPDVLSRFHLQELRLGDEDNHILIASDGTISFKAEAIKTELTLNSNDSSFKAQSVGLGIEHTKEGAFGVLAAPGVHLGPVDLSAGLEVTFDPRTGVIAPSGEYRVGLGHLIATDGSIHEQWNPATGDLGTQVSLGGEFLGARHEVRAAEFNDQFVSTSTTDSLQVGSVSVSRTHSQSLTPDGSYVDSTGTTETFSKSFGLDTTYFAVKADPVSVSHSNVSVTSTTADGTRTESNVSTNSGGW